MKTILNIIGIIVPILLILMLTVDFSEGVVSGKDDFFEKVVRRSIFAVIIFLLPIMVDFSLGLIRSEKDRNSFQACWNDANVETISMWREVAAAEKKAKKAQFDLEQEQERIKQAQLEEERKQKALADLGPVTLKDRDANTCYYFQTDYKAYKYGSYGTISSHGCGPTSTAVIGCTLVQSKQINPVNSTNWICSKGGCTSSGTVMKTLQSYLSNLGLKVSGIYQNTYSNRQIMDNALKNGGMGLVLAKRGIFTGGGHYFVVNKDLGSSYQIVEVASRVRTNQTWPKSTFWGSSANIKQFFVVAR